MNFSSHPAAAKAWTGRYLEDLAVGDTFKSRLGRTVTEADNIWFTCLTMNTNQVHFNTAYAEGTQFGRLLVNSTLTLALVSGLSVADLSENAIANLGWSDVVLPNPVFVGDTLWAESQVLEIRESRSRAGVGIVATRTRGVNQRSEVVLTMGRTFMLPSRATSSAPGAFPNDVPTWD